MDDTRCGHCGNSDEPGWACDKCETFNCKYCVGIFGCFRCGEV